MIARKLFISVAASLLLCSSLTLASQPNFLEHLNLLLPEPQVLDEITSYKLIIERKFQDHNVYTTKMRMGSAPTQPVELVLATDTEWTMVTGTNCTQEFGCARGIYNSSLSNSEHIDETPILKSVDLGDNYNLTGENVTDVLYMSDGITMIAKDFPFFIISSVKFKKGGNLFPFDGVLGLSPDVSGDTYFTLGQPLPLYLKSVNKIKQAIIGIDMQPAGSESSLTLGTVDTSLFRNKSETYDSLKWFSVPTNTGQFSWRHEIKNVFYAGKSFDDGFVNTGIFDSFYGGIYLPRAEWTNTFTELQANLTRDGMNFLQCNMTTMQCFFQGECK